MHNKHQKILNVTVCIVILTASSALAGSCGECLAQELRDASGRLMGKIIVRSEKLEGRDASGRLQGTYDCKTNQTRKPDGQAVGSGNSLAHLILEES